MADKKRPLDNPRIPSDQPMYVISIAAELANVHPQTLRMYERKRLVTPKRSAGRIRLYSESDIEWIREIQYLTQQVGINLAGVARIAELQKQLAQAHASIDELNREAEAIRQRFRAEIAEIFLHYSPQIKRHSSGQLAPTKKNK